VSAFWLAFLLPFVLLPLASWSWRMRHPGSYQTPAWTRARCLIAIVGGAGVGLFCFAHLPALMDASTLYLTDPSCTTGVAARFSRGEPACHTENATIVRAVESYSRGRNVSYILDLALDDGSRPKVAIIQTVAGMNVWRQASTTPGLAARANMFQGHVLALTTNAGTAKTAWNPQLRISEYQFWALFGAGLMVSGLIELLFSWQSLF
jgi:hypothetical protein